MTYEYTPPASLLEKNQFGPGGAGSFKKVDSKKNSIGTDITGINGDDLFNMFGMSPEKAYGDFDASYKKANAAFKPFDSSRLDAERDRNSDLYQKAEGIADVSETLGALQKARGSTLTAGQQLANNASRKFQETSSPGGSSGVGAAMVRAQSLLPFLQNDYQGAASEREYADSKKTEAINSASNVAQTLANLATTYTNSLANYNATKAGNSLDFAGTRTDLGLKASSVGQGNKLDLLKTQMQLAENARQANMQNSQFNLSHSLAERQYNRSQSKSSNPIPAFAGNMGFTNNTGVLTPSAEYAAYKSRYGI